MKDQKMINKIVNYIENEVFLTRNMVLNIYKDGNKLHHTVGSMEYRDKKHLITLKTMDEIPKNIKEWVEFESINK